MAFVIFYEFSSTYVLDRRLKQYSKWELGPEDADGMYTPIEWVTDPSRNVYSTEDILSTLRGRLAFGKDSGLVHVLNYLNVIYNDNNCNLVVKDKDKNITYTRYCSKVNSDSKSLRCP